MKKMKLKLLILSIGLLSTVILAASASAQSAPQRIEITARRSVYTPVEITVKKGQPVILVLKSTDVGHGLRIRELGIDLQVKAGGTAEAQFTPDKTGDFIGHCSVFCGPGHGSMQITLHVVE